MTKRSPYLKEGRLADVVAGITVLGTYPFYKLSVERWAMRIGGAHSNPEHWRIVFREHPEFFREAAESGLISLVWRRQFRRNFRVDAELEVSPDYEHDGTAADRVSRRPLTPNEVTELVGVAIKMHDRALEQRKSRVWWVPLAAAGLSLIGALVGSLLPNLWR